MTDEEIPKLAEQYADKECAMSKHTGKKLQQLHEDKIVEFYDVFGFLIERFCIVPRNNARELYQLVIDNQCSVDYALIDGLSDWVEINFGKDMFEEDKI